MRGDYANIYSRFSRKCKGAEYLVIRDKVGSCDIEVFFGSVHYGHVDHSAYFFRVKRCITVWNDYALCFGLFFGNGGAVIIVSDGFFGDDLPHLNEHHRQIPYSLTSQHNSGIFPVTEADKAVNVFIGDIHAACEAHISVNHKYLAVVAVVLYGGDHGAEAVEYQHSASRLFYGFYVAGRHCEL